ncbi:MAG: TetR/AcrR family transcriptional regulator, regulator of autoinduction and epiphytic fitness [Thermoleophilaceae bacterium]|nr:TetR/AcrR family transcriptional regulator, regulator of autoinduction and epiphytic fitness [Thermoleophilaceae bacterium]MEA2409174.1 TetR/AcrR family transcriptional regulator, regulator of autoinduction and epiphytic fitness [Thermoleophilaceae bacterium]
MPEETKDGRTIRAERTRQALEDALLALLHEGDVRPTAERIAARAGVSERSLFQHFADREELYQAVAVKQFERIIPTLRPIDASRPLPERIDAFVDQRARLLETVTPVRRGALLLEPDSEVVSLWLAKARKAKVAETARVFAAEIERAPEHDRSALGAALGAVSAWSFWESLRAHQQLSVDASRAAMREAIAALLGER